MYWTVTPTWWFILYSVHSYCMARLLPTHSHIYHHCLAKKKKASSGICQQVESLSDAGNCFLTMLISASTNTRQWIDWRSCQKYRLLTGLILFSFFVLIMSMVADQYYLLGWPTAVQNGQIIITKMTSYEIPGWAELSRAGPGWARGGKRSQPRLKLSWTKLVEGRAESKPRSIELWVFESVIRVLIELRLPPCDQKSSRYFQSEGTHTSDL